MTDASSYTQRFAPCGLDCSRCASCTEGSISRAAAQLLTDLKGFQRMLPFLTEKKPEFHSYTDFEKILAHFAAPVCGGCRSDNNTCSFQCPVQHCLSEEDVDFCFQCSRFPCEKPFDERIRQRWLENNLRMKEIGVKAFAAERDALPRY